MDRHATTEPLAALDVLYAEVDGRAAALAGRHADRLRCRHGCSACCVDELTVFTVEAERIRRRHGDLLAEGTPGPAGGCAFLDEDGGCRIYEDRPYVCRTQGLPLRWLDEAPGGDELVEYRDICPLNDEDGPPIELLPGESCWSIGPFEQRLASLQRAFGGDHSRVALRRLFPDNAG